MLSYTIFSAVGLTAPKSTGLLEPPGPIFHDTSEEQKRAQAYIAAGYVPFGHHLQKAIDKNHQRETENVCDLNALQKLYLNQQFDKESSLEDEETFPYFFDEEDPSFLDSGPALPDLITDLGNTKREKRDYTGRLNHIIKLRKKDKVYTEGRIQSSHVAALCSDQEESYQTVPPNFMSKIDPKLAIGKMATSVHGGGVGPNDRSGGNGSHTGSVPSTAQTPGGSGGPLSHLKISDLIHPSLNDPLKSQQQVTFRLVKTGRS